VELVLVAVVALDRSRVAQWQIMEPPELLALAGAVAVAVVSVPTGVEALAVAEQAREILLQSQGE
jgi:hypothetical protein